MTLNVLIAGNQQLKDVLDVKTNGIVEETAKSESGKDIKPCVISYSRIKRMTKIGTKRQKKIRKKE